jgi:hypothetical protein
LAILERFQENAGRTRGEGLPVAPLAFVRRDHAHRPGNRSNLLSQLQPAHSRQAHINHQAPYVGPVRI